MAGVSKISKERSFSYKVYKGYTIKITERILNCVFYAILLIQN
ncbi:hypothetical protein EW15_0080 [Prochlorococcus sp. MIT 0801]|nr:hypothetical protein EW15_0080 [Prochlorococcus sp. MIT 0801]